LDQIRTLYKVRISDRKKIEEVDFIPLNLWPPSSPWSAASRQLDLGCTARTGLQDKH